jgi:signal transduction histidine kinase
MIRARLLAAGPLRLAIFGVAFVALVTAGALLAVQARIEALIRAEQAQAARLELRLFAEVDRQEGRDGLVRAILRRLEAEPDLPLLYVLADQEGRRLTGSIDWPLDFPTDQSWRDVRLNGKVIGAAAATILPDGARLLVGDDLSDRDRLRGALIGAFVGAMLVVAFFATATGVILNRVLLGRIGGFVGAAHRIMAGDLGERMAQSGVGGPFDDLARALNAMLDRNAALIGQMRAVTDAIAHDLRMPLQRIHAALERALGADSETARIAAITRAQSEGASALSTFDTLLEVARAEAGVGRDTFADVDLGKLVEDVAELFGPVAEDKNQTLIASASPVTVKGQGVLLRQALANLVQNAIKYTPSGGSIAVICASAASGAELIVRDNGPGIPEAARARVVQPFGRLARDQDNDGVGLGLAFVSAVAKLHFGALHLEDAKPGLLARLTLPKP